MNSRIIFTGGPGSGKTSVIEFLKSLGYKGVAETGRKVIQMQVALQGTALPWGDKAAFRDEMIREEIRNYKAFGGSTDIVFFDRSIIDSYGYSMLERIPVSDLLLRSCSELVYNQKVFIFPPWESIYANDVERKQDFNEAVATYHEMLRSYRKFGYELVEVPTISIRERAEFILARVRPNEYIKHTAVSSVIRYEN